MARGFDSKSVEEQQAAFAAKAPADQPRAAPFTAEEAELNRQRELLILSRKQVAAQLETATAPRHRQMLESALTDMDRRIQEYEKA